MLLALLLLLTPARPAHANTVYTCLRGMHDVFLQMVWMGADVDLESGALYVRYVLSKSDPISMNIMNSPVMRADMTRRVHQACTVNRVEFVVR